MRRIILIQVLSVFTIFFLPAQGGPVVGDVPQPVEDRLVPDPSDLYVESWIEGLVIPWDLVFLSEEKALVTERPGRVRIIDKGKLLPEPYLEIDVSPVGEGGLMGIAVHPRYPREPYIYLMYTYRESFSSYNKDHASNYTSLRVYVASFG